MFYNNDFLIVVGTILGFIYLAYNEEDSLFYTFKDVHQSNLDGIEQQEKEEAN